MQRMEPRETTKSTYMTCCIRRHGGPNTVRYLHARTDQSSSRAERWANLGETLAAWKWPSKVCLSGSHLVCAFSENYDTPCESVLRQCHKAWVCSLNLLHTHYLEITSLKTTSVCMFGVPDSPICRITQGPAWGGPGLSPKPCLLYFSPSHWATEILARQTCSCCLKAFLLLFPLPGIWSSSIIIVRD